MYRLTKLWTNFATNGDPNPPKKDPLINLTWKPCTNINELNFFDIGTELGIIVNPDCERMKFWNEILPMQLLISKL